MTWLPLDINNHQPPSGLLFENLPPKLLFKGPWLRSGSQGFLLTAVTTSVNLLIVPSVFWHHSDVFPRGSSFLIPWLHPHINTMIF